ncbi:MAG: PilZ domain-containing protein [Phycisphaerales bacterium]|nr:PilZ domain-containing protein [Phycisphaerales bacterium]
MTRNSTLNPASDPAIRNTLFLDGVLYQRILSKLDESSNKQKPSASRIFRRLSYAHAKIAINIQSEGHNQRTLIVATRNLSQGGMSILHSSFMYTGTQLTVDLITNTGDITTCYGSVTRCEHRGGRVHEIGIKFDDEIILREYLNPNPKNLLHSREKVDHESMDIKLLVVSSNTDFSSTMREYFQPTSMIYKFAKSDAEALELFQAQDMVLLHLDTVTMQTPETISQMREQGFTNPIIIAGRPTSEEDSHIISACGADMILPWPCDEQTILCSIGEYIFNSWTAESLENIRSCISPETRRVLYVELAKIGITLDQQVRTQNQEGAHISCSRIRVLAPLLNLVALKSAIDDLTKRLSKAESLESLAPELNQISMACKGMSQKAA